ncbi:MAG: hypothetical protein MJZ61_01300 [Bacteroidales bacterium]|nr:hypothetical protein [Bacteroidales bacterium]
MKEIIAKTAFCIKVLIVLVCLIAPAQDVMGAEPDTIEPEEESPWSWGLIIYLIVAWSLSIWVWAKEYGYLFKNGGAGILAGLGMVFLSMLASCTKACGCDLAYHGVKKATELVTNTQ